MKTSPSYILYIIIYYTRIINTKPVWWSFQAKERRGILSHNVFIWWTRFIIHTLDNGKREQSILSTVPSNYFTVINEGKDATLYSGSCILKSLSENLWRTIKCPLVHFTVNRSLKFQHVNHGKRYITLDYILQELYVLYMQFSFKKISRWDYKVLFLYVHAQTHTQTKTYCLGQCAGQFWIVEDLIIKHRKVKR